MSKPIFKMLRGGSENTFETVELDRESRRYVHVNVKNIHHKWDEFGQLIVTNTTYDLDRCTSDFFSHTAVEQDYFESRKDQFLYCMQDENIYLQNTLDSEIHKHEHSFIIVEIQNCHDAIRRDDDPECAPIDEINQWIRTKVIQYSVLDNRIDFTQMDEYAVRQTEIALPNAPMKYGYYSDTGYRFRKNTFNRNDEWYPFGGEWQETFYDMTIYNSDTYMVNEDHNLIAEMYFRLDTNEVQHQRTVK